MIKVLGTRKAQGVIELLVAVVIIFLFVVITVFGNKILSDFNTDYQADSSVNAESKAVVSDLNTRYSITFDALVPFIFVILLLVCVVAGWLSNTHPFVMIFLLFIVIFLMIVGGILSNAWEDLKVDDSLSAVVVNYPMTDYILSHYLLFVGVMGFCLLAAILLRNRIGD
jgi:hypothetical protein